VVTAIQYSIRKTRPVWVPRPRHFDLGDLLSRSTTWERSSSYTSSGVHSDSIYPAGGRGTRSLKCHSKNLTEQGENHDFIGLSKELASLAGPGGALCFVPLSCQWLHSEKHRTWSTSRPQQVRLSAERFVCLSNDLAVKMEDGSLRDFFSMFRQHNRPTVDGRQLNVPPTQPCYEG